MSGTAWVASFVPGQVTLLDGSTGAIVDQLSGSRLPGVRPGDHIEVAQAGSGAYVADTHTGVLDRIDGATHDVVSARDVVSADGADIQMYPATNHLFVVDPRRGRVTIVDPLTLRASTPALPLRAEPAATVLDPQGHLWFVDMTTKRLDELNGDHIRPTSVTVNPSDRVGAGPGAGSAGPGRLLRDRLHRRSPHRAGHRSRHGYRRAVCLPGYQP